MQAPWICDWCCRTFGKKEHLLRHERAHTEAKPYQCPVCAQQFGRQDVLVRHVKVKHPSLPFQRNSLRRKSDSKSRTSSAPPHQDSDHNVNQPSPSTADEKSSPLAPDGILTLQPTAPFIPLDFSGTLHVQSATAEEQQVQPTDRAPSPLPDSLTGSGYESSTPLFNDDSSSLFAFDSPTFYDFATSLPATTVPIDFDLDAMLGAFLATPAHDVAARTVQPSGANAAHSPFTGCRSDPESTQHWNLVANAWPTHYESSQTSSLFTWAPPIDTEGSHIDDSIVQALQEGLQSPPNPPSSRAELLLEPDFLRAALDCFWTCVYPSFPIVHQATFQPKRYPLLTLSLVCIGSVYIGNAKSRHMSAELYHRVKHQVIMRSVDGCASSIEPGQDIALMQAGFFGQLYGALCGNALALHTSRMYNTPLVNFARNLLLVSDQKTDHGAIWSIDRWDNETWALWIEAECVKRAVYGLIWQSAFLGSVMSGPTPHLLQVVRLEWPASEAAFSAKSAYEARHFALLDSNGAEIASASNPPYWRTVTSLLSGRFDLAAFSAALEPANEQKSAAVLNGLAVAIHALPGGIWGNYLNDGARLAARNALLLWYELHVQSEGTQARQDPLMMMEAFHLAFLHLLVPFEIIELACGKEGPVVLHEPWLVEHLTVWAATPSARLALLHAGQVWALLDLSHRRRPGGLLLPTAATHAALIIWTYQRFAARPLATQGVQMSVELTDQFDWLALEDDSNPREANARSFLNGIGQCTLGGVRCDHSEPSHPCSSFAAQLVGTSCWGQTQQSILLLNLLASPLSAKI